MGRVEADETKITHVHTKFEGWVAHKHLENWTEAGSIGDRAKVIVDAAKEVGPSLFFSLLIITVSFLPVFTLEAQEGRLFKPLAYTKTFSMFFAALLSVTLVPVLMVLLIRGKIAAEHKNPISRVWNECRTSPTVLFERRA